MHILIALLVLAMSGSQRPVPERPEYQHGHLADVPFIVDSDGVRWSGSSYAFLAVKIDPNVTPVTCIDYVQEVDYLAQDGYELRRGAAIARCTLTSEADEDGWLFLRLAKPCAPGETSTDVGLVTVCPPRTSNLVAACDSPTSGIPPIYFGVPPETVPCSPSRRRAVRH